MSSAPKKTAAPTQPGTVVASFGRQFTVELEDGVLIACVTRGKRTDIACGDRVAVAMTAPDQGVIESTAPRVSLFYRSDIQREKLIAANVTQIVIVLASSPPFHAELLDRCLAAAEEAGIPALLALNKMDLPAAAQALQSLERYRALGYDVLPLAAKIDIAPLRARLAGHTSVLVGQSGMGKSTIINRLLPDAAARVGELSVALGGGRHTTTHARLYHLDAASHIIDSPGLQEFGLVHVAPEDLAHAFIELRQHLGQCKFNDCKHLTEPGCAITAAVERGEIDAQRVESYRKLVMQLMKKAQRWE
ncbi:MAG: ribosome small subunit-dependent GTPase A [Proteobacteria bacterium]|nr:ribosome small subunit-dependent GTPase A [Pseudomonadota bacterium]